MFGEDTRTQLLTLSPGRRMPLAQVDAVVDHVDALRVNRRVAAQDVLAHSVGYGNDGGGGFVGRFFDVGGQAVPTPELLRLPGAQGLQGVSGDHVRNIAEEGGNVARKIRIPRVGVHQVCSVAGCGNLEVNTERAQGGIGSGQLGQVVVSTHSRLGAIRSGFTRAVERLHPQVIDQSTQDLRKLKDVDTGSAVDVGGILAGKQINAHDVVLPTVAALEAHCIRCHIPPGQNETT